MIQQVDAQLHQYLQGVKRAVCLVLYRVHRYKKSIACLMSIKQREKETLRSYITHFNKETLSIDETDDKILVAAFTSGLQKGKFLFFLYQNDPKTMSDVLYKATKYMRRITGLRREAQEKRKTRGCMVK